MRETRTTVLETLLKDDPRQSVLGTAVLNLAIGVFLLLPFAVFADPRSYRFMRYLAEDTWSAIFIGLGLAKIALWLLKPILSRSGARYLPFTLSCAEAVFWVVIWAGVYTSNPHTLGTVVYFWLVLAAVWIALRQLLEAWKSR